MTHKKLNYLLVSLISLLLCLLIFSTSARASGPIAPEIKWSAGAFITGNFAGGAGYSPGVGALAEAQVRWKFLEFKLSGGATNQRKKRSAIGYTYGGTAQLRGYVWQDFYLLGAYSLGGYSSQFENGTTWAKSGSNYGLGIGYHPDFMDVNFIVFNKEDLSPNKVWYCSWNTQFQIWRYVWGMVNLKYMTFDQMNQGQMERWNALNSTIGIGVRF